MQRALFAMQRIAEPIQVGMTVFLFEKAGSTVVAPLYDVKRNTVEMDTWASRHSMNARRN
jgi:hypothetical protein